MIYTDRVDSLIGPLAVAVDHEGRLLQISFGDLLLQSESIVDPDRCIHVTTQLRQYFSKQRETFGLELAPAGTDFQKRVWSVLSSIPYGSTTTYRDVAIRSGNIKAIRAVGRANGANPIPIVVPCHRVIGSDGSLTGFGGGMRAKAILLELEGARSGELFR